MEVSGSLPNVFLERFLHWNCITIYISLLKKCCNLSEWISLSYKMYVGLVHFPFILNSLNNNQYFHNYFYQIKLFEGYNLNLFMSSLFYFVRFEWMYGDEF